MNKYSAALLSLASLLLGPLANAAGDSFNPVTSILTIPAVNVGSASFNNVAVRLDNFTVLTATSAPPYGGVVYEDSQIRVTIKASSRGQASSTGASSASFSLLITNKMAIDLKINGYASDANSTLSDEYGNVCVPTITGVPTRRFDPTDEATYLHVLSGGSFIIGISGCDLPGNKLNLISSLDMHDPSNVSIVNPLPFSFFDLAFPIPQTPYTTTACASGGMTKTSYDVIGPGMTVGQVSQILGANYDPNLVYTTPTSTTYVWKNGANIIYVTFDPSGFYASKFAKGF